MARQTLKKSALAKQAEKLFFGPVTTPIAWASFDRQPLYGDGLRVVQSFTTYAACEEPIPNLVKTS